MTNGNLNCFDPSDNDDVEAIDKSMKIIYQSIKKIKLDLANLNILTEASTGNWIYTPFIAAIAGGNVFCLTRNSMYGKAKDIIDNFMQIAEFLDVKDKMHVYDNLTKDVISKADIVTNSGFLRPIDKKFIFDLKKSSVISLMWEPWEYRKKDLDLHSCNMHGICVLGVNESNKSLNIMKYAGDLILRIFSEHNVKLKNKKIILLGENKSALYMVKPILKHGVSSLCCISSTMKNDFKTYGVDVKGSNLNEKKIEPWLRDSDIIIIDSYPIQQSVLGGAHALSPKRLKILSPQVKVFIYFGKINYPEVKKFEIDYYPKRVIPYGHMGWTADILGPKISIELGSLGLKVGEIMARYRLSGCDVTTTIKKSLKHDICLDFSKEQKQKYF